MATKEHEKTSSQGIAGRYWAVIPWGTYRNDGFAPNTNPDKMSLAQAQTMAATNLRFKNRIRQLPSGKRT
jgi:hypothetical protein